MNGAHRGYRVALVCLVLLLAGCTKGGAEEAHRPNVLLVIVDDLRPALGCYGDSRARTPNLDGLARQGILFRRAYCSQATCHPSRAALLTGRRPESLGVFDTHTGYRERVPNLVALPELFLRAGYRTEALGKVHHGHGSLDDLRAWSVKPWRPDRWQRWYGRPETLEAIERLRREAAQSHDQREMLRQRFFAVEAPDLPEDEFPDGRIAAEAIRRLEAMGKQPFFLAVGFLKPHLPFVAPKRFWDLFPPGSLAPDPRRRRPRGAPDLAFTNSAEVRAFWSVPDEGPIEGAVAEELVRGYYACAAFVDAQIGRLLEALERTGHADDTIVVVLGDHGWHLGDLGEWGKNTNFELATRSPLLMRIPGRAGGRTIEAVVELVDLYPTLAELCGLDPPEGLEGRSLVPLLEGQGAGWPDAALHVYRRGVGPQAIMGRAIRTRRSRLVEWRSTDGALVAVELYDDQGRGEDENVAEDPSYAEERRRLSERLANGWRGIVGKPDGREER